MNVKGRFFKVTSIGDPFLLPKNVYITEMLNFLSTYQLVDISARVFCVLVTTVLCECECVFTV